VLVARRDQLLRLDLTFGEEPRAWQLEIRPDATADQKKHFESWIGH
jgi:hypothetical protein